MSNPRETRAQRIARQWIEFDIDRILSEPIKIIETRVFFHPRQDEFRTHTPPKHLPKEARDVQAPQFNKDGTPSKKRGPKPKPKNP